MAKTRMMGDSLAKEDRALVECWRETLLDWGGDPNISHRELAALLAIIDDTSAELHALKAFAPLLTTTPERLALHIATRLDLGVDLVFEVLRKFGMSYKPKCLYCGRIVPARRFATSDYCTEKCARDETRADEESAKSEREDMAKPSAERVPTASEIDGALAGAIHEEEIWVEKFELNEWNDPNYLEAAEQSRRTVEVLRWLRAHHATLSTPVS